MAWVIVNGDDWQGIYDAETGELRDEGHSLPLDRVLDVTGVSYTSRWEDAALMEYGRCPPTLDELEALIERMKRKARCWQCGGSVVPSAPTLCGIKLKPDHEYDEYYCGCRGWD